MKLNGIHNGALQCQSTSMAVLSLLDVLLPLSQVSAYALASQCCELGICTLGDLLRCVQQHLGHSSSWIYDAVKLCHSLSVVAKLYKAQTSWALG